MSGPALAGLSRLAVRRPVTTLMAFLALAACGLLAWRNLPVELLPRFQSPQLYVIAALPGASPEAVEQDVLRRLEGEIATLEGVEELSSRAETGQAIVTVKLRRDADVDLASLRIQQRLAAIRPELSDQAQLFVQRFDTSLVSSFVMSLSLRGDGDMEALRREAEDTVVPLLQAVPGVVDVALSGGASKQVAVLVDLERARLHGASAADVRQALVESSRPVQSVGEAVDPARRLPVVVDGRARRVSDVADAPVAATGARVRDVAEIQLALASSVERYRIDGLSSVQVTVRKDPQANLLAVAARLRSAVAAYGAEHASAGRELHVDFDGSKILRDTLDELLKRAATGAVLALLVLLVFLRDARTVSVIAVAIPATLLVAADLFALSGLSVNILSLLGLAVSVGLLLDNAIVVLEAITRRRERGDDAATAAERGVGLVARAVISGTATTLIVFVPLFVVEADWSPLFRELALSVMLPLVASLLVAVTLLPMVAARLGARWQLDDVVRWPVPGGAPRPGWPRSIYSAVLRQALRAPAITCVLTLTAVVAALAFGLPLVLVFAEPPRDPAERISIRAELPAGSTIDAADHVAMELERLAAALPQVDEVRASVQEELVTVDVSFLEKEKRTGPVLVDRERRGLREKVTGLEGGSVRAEIEVDPQPEEGSEEDAAGAGALGGGGRETVRVKGPPGQPLTDLARRVREILEQSPGVTGVAWDVGTSRPTLEIVPDRRRLAELGLPPASILGLLWTTRREGERLPDGLRLGDEEVELSLYIEGGDARTIEDVRRFPLATPQGELVALETVASVRTGADPPVARRHEGERTITLSYGFDAQARGSGEAVEAARAEVDRVLGALTRPAGHGIEIEHADDEGLGVLEKMVLLGLLLVFAVLAMTFESATLPFLVLLAVPLAAVGVVASLALTGTGLNEMVILALVVLLGLVVNQGILFIDRSEQLVTSGSRRAPAILRAAQERLRPILMTTTATTVGLLPLAIDKGGEQEIWPPFGRALLGGLVTGTLISLVFLPAAALLFGRLRDVLREMGPAWVAGTSAVAAAVLGWAFFVAELVTTTPMRAIVALPAWVAFVVAAAGLRKLARGERPPDLVGDGAPIVRARNARKIYGGDPRLVRDARRVERWRAIGARLGMSVRDLYPPAELRRQATWQAGALGLLAWLVTQAQSTWGRLLLSVAMLLVLGAACRTIAALAGRPGAWPPAGPLRRVVPLLALGATWLVLLLARRPGNDADGFTLVLAAIAFAAWAGAHLLRRGGIPGMIARGLAPAPKLALGGVSLEFGPGLHGLLGPNGAGKSTLMRLIVNLYRPTRGSVTINGHEVHEHSASLQPAIGFLPQFFGVPKRLTARQYLEHQALLTGMLDPAERAARVQDVLEKVGLAERSGEAMGGFSGGMRQRVGIARTLLNAPRIVVVDEPTVGLDPRERIRFRNLLADLAQDRVVLLSTHVVEDIGSSCREVVVLDGGRVLFRGAPSELTERARGLAWNVEIDEDALPELQRSRRVVASATLPGGRVLARGVGAPPEGSELVEPSLEDAYLLLLGRKSRELPDVA